MNKTKKIVICSVVVVFLFIIMVIFGSRNELEETICTFESNQNNYKLNIEYNIYSKNMIVIKTVANSTYESSDKDLLKNIKKEIGVQYKSLNDKYSGYSYKFTMKKNKLYSVVKIDYKKHDMKKFVYDNVAMKNFINEKKQFTLDGAIDYYESMGAICKK